MNYKQVLLLSAVILSLTGCGKKMEEAEEAAKALKQLGDASKNMEKNMAENEVRQEARRKRGDTLAIVYQELQKYLPPLVSGGNAQDPEGTTMNMEGMSYSTASQHFVAGEEEVDVTIIDYNASGALYAAAVAFWGGNFSMETSEEMSKSFATGIDGVQALETFHKKSREAEVTYAVAGRFLVTVKATHQSGTEKVKSIASSMRLKDLAAL